MSPTPQNQPTETPQDASLPESLEQQVDEYVAVCVGHDLTCEGHPTCICDYDHRRVDALRLAEITFLAGIAEGRRQASAAVLAIVEQQLDRLDAVAYTVDIRDMRDSSRPVIASVVDRNAAMHMLLFVREALRREQGITQGADQ